MYYIHFDVFINIQLLLFIDKQNKFLTTGFYTVFVFLKIGKILQQKPAK